MSDLETQRTIVLTGATRGLGRAMADGFIERGHVVAGCGRSSDAIDDLTQTYAVPHHWSVVDVTDDNAVAAWAGRVIEAVGVPDLLINNAAVINANAPLWEVSAEDFDRLTAVNINGVANVIRAFVPNMIEVGRGVIVNFSSGWGRSTSPQVAPYCASKWAIEGLTRALAQELPDGLAAIALNPGVIHTDMLASCFGSAASSYPTPPQWAERAVPALLKMNSGQTGHSLEIG